MDKEYAFVLKRFSDYYSKAKFNIPQIEKREFGFGLEKKIDSRHLGFANEQEFRSFLVNNTPLYVSHSVAYYNFPHAKPMERKGWLGADLVFDLDFESENKYLSKDDFAKVRADALRLVEEFLISDFGVQKHALLINFSGNRGFHIHVREQRFSQLKGNERKEIIEYIKGIGLKYEYFVQEDANIKGKLSGPVPSDSGYAGRFAKRVLELLASETDPISSTLKKEERLDFSTKFQAGIKSGNWSLSQRTGAIEKKLREILENELSLQTVNIDGGVTQDVSKLIRVPNSIHGSTGLSAKILSLKELASFEPMHHALVFSQRPIKIVALENVPEIEIGNTTQEKISKGEEKEVPEYFAIYLKLKGSAKLLV